MKIPVEQFVAPLTTGKAARAEVGAQNGFRVPEKVRIAPRWAARRVLIRPRATLAGYMILWFPAYLPSVSHAERLRVSDLLRLYLGCGLIWQGCGCFCLRGGRGSEFVGATGFLYWISRREKFSHWTGGEHGHGC